MIAATNLVYLLRRTQARMVHGEAICGHRLARLLNSSHVDIKSRDFSLVEMRQRQSRRPEPGGEMDEVEMDDALMDTGRTINGPRSATGRHQGLNDSGSWDEGRTWGAK
jgi:hypothetical protein